MNSYNEQIPFDANKSTFNGDVYTVGYNSELTYDQSSASYQGILTVNATANSQLGGLNATGQATVTHFATASTSADFNATVISSVTNLVSANAQLGQIDATATAIVTHQATAQALLGGITANANTLPTVLPLFEAQLGGLQAQATATVIQGITAIADAQLGGLVANANTTVTPPTPPEPQPETQLFGSNRPYASPQAPKKPAPLPEPPKVVITESPKARPVRVPATIVAKAGAVTSTPKFVAQSQIEWSILEDEAELLLLI